ncbi:MAG: HipA domain-containing protein [Balneolaceae bacterium]
MNRCLICAEPLPEGAVIHSECSRKLYDSDTPPSLGIGRTELSKLAKKTIRGRVTVPGVQTKLSLDLDSTINDAHKFTIVGLWGRYILKPPSPRWPELPANEHCTMLMAQSAGIEVVPFGLIPLASGELSYITRRVDRDRERKKYAMEDMCQLTGRLTEDKYKGSHEQIAKSIKRHTENPLFDLTRFFELVLFCYVTGNGDMHLKNFSLLNDPTRGWSLSPAYDLLSTRLVIPESEDPEELALTLTGKKSHFQARSFQEFGETIGLNRKQISNIIERLLDKRSAFEAIIENSFLTAGMKSVYKEVLAGRYEVVASPSTS